MKKFTNSDPEGVKTMQKWKLSIDYDKFKKEFDNEVETLNKRWADAWASGDYVAAHEISARIAGMHEVMKMLLGDATKFEFVEGENNEQRQYD